MTDPIDEFWVPAIGTYKDKPFKSATRGGADLDKITPARGQQGDEKPEPPAKLASLIAIFKLALGDAVKDVRSSDRLTDSAVCLVADEGDMDMHLERLLKQHRQLDTDVQAHPRAEPASQADRATCRGWSARVGASDQLSEFAWLLLDQARIVEGEQLPDPRCFRAPSCDLARAWLACSGMRPRGRNSPPQLLPERLSNAPLYRDRDVASTPKVQAG